MPSFIPDGIFYPSLCHYPTIRRSCAPPIQPSNLSTTGCEPSVFSSHSRILWGSAPSLLIHLFRSCPRQVPANRSFASHSRFLRGLAPPLLTHQLKIQGPSWAGSSKLRFRPITPSLKIRTPPWKISANRRLRAAGVPVKAGTSGLRPLRRLCRQTCGPPRSPPASALRQKDAERPFSVSPASLRLGLFTCSSPDRPPQRRLRSRPPWGCCPYR